MPEGDHVMGLRLPKTEDACPEKLIKQNFKSILRLLKVNHHIASENCKMVLCMADFATQKAYV